METHGVPSDMIPNINSFAVLLALPLVTHFLYSMSRRRAVSLHPLRRIALGFFFEACGMAYAAGIQAWIYNSGPCYRHPRACPESLNGLLPNQVNTGVQAPVYLIE